MEDDVHSLEQGLALLSLEAMDEEPSALEHWGLPRYPLPARTTMVPTTGDATPALTRARLTRRRRQVGTSRTPPARRRAPPSRMPGKRRRRCTWPRRPGAATERSLPPAVPVEPPSAVQLPVAPLAAGPRPLCHCWKRVCADQEMTPPHPDAGGAVSSRPAAHRGGAAARKAALCRVGLRRDERVSGTVVVVCLMKTKREAQAGRCVR